MTKTRLNTVGQEINMTQTARNRTVKGMDTGESGVRENDAHIAESVSRVKSKDGPAMVYITYMVLGAVFVLGCVCGRAFGNFGITSN